MIPRQGSSVTNKRIDLSEIDNIMEIEQDLPNENVTTSENHVEESLVNGMRMGPAEEGSELCNDAAGKRFYTLELNKKTLLTVREDN